MLKSGVFAIFGIFIGLFSLLSPLRASDDISATKSKDPTTYPLANIRETGGQTDHWLAKWYLKRLRKKEDPTRVQLFLDQIFERDFVSRGCSHALLLRVEKAYPEAGLERSYKRNLKGLLYAARKQHFIDDVALELLLETRKDLKRFDPEDSPGLFRRSTDKKMREQQIQAYRHFEKAMKKSPCLTVHYPNFMAQIKESTDREVDDKFLRRLNVQAIRKNRIEGSTYSWLEIARKREILERSLSLRSYLEKRRRILRRYPKAHEQQRSPLVTQEIDGEKRSYRQRLYERYSATQIDLLRELVVKMRKRFNASSVVIHVMGPRGEVIERIALDPLEQYRFVTKMVRVDLSNLQNSGLFGGKKIYYLDLVSAAFETALIGEKELGALMKIEELWNPKKDLKDKVLEIVKKYGGLSAALLPPGYNLIPMVGILVLEAFTRDDDRTLEREHSLF